MRAIDAIPKIILFNLSWISLSFTCNIYAQSNSVLSTGEWYKFGVTKSAIYKIDYGLLQSSGIDPTQIDPRNIKLFGNGGQMLSQKNSDPRPFDLVENAIFVFGEDDGRFDSGDYILFHGKDPDTYYYDLDKNSFYYTNNLYSDTTFYYLNSSASNGLRVKNTSSLGVNNPKIVEFDHYQSHEVDTFNIMRGPDLKGGSGRKWYGDIFSGDMTKSFFFNFEGLTSTSNLVIVSSVLAESFESPKFTISVNGLIVGEQIVPAIPNTQYGNKGAVRTDTFNISAALLDDNIKIDVSYQKAGTSKSNGYIDFLFVTGKRKLAKYNGQTFFRSLSSLENPLSTFSIPGIDNGTMIWDVTESGNILNQEFELNSNLGEFGTETTILKEFVIFKLTELFPIPEFIEQVSNQNLHNIKIPDLVIISHPDFMSEAERLAQLRRDHDKLGVIVVTTKQVFNEFGSGSSDPTAIRDFMKYLYDRDQQKLKYLLLFGKGTYDYKNKYSKHNNFVPVYESRNSLHPLKTYSSDDYFGFLDDEEGEWIESIDGDLITELGIGRLPVTSVNEAQYMVNKYINYETNFDTQGNWRNNIYFVADDGDFNIHQKQAERLAVLVDSIFPQFNVKKIYLDAFPQVVEPGAELSPEAKDKLKQTVNNGALIVNFTGHGGEKGWTDERILRLDEINGWDNYNTLPLFVTATCEFGRHDDPFQTSGGELTVLNPKGGGIAIVTTARPVFSSTNFALNLAFYNAAFTLVNGEYQRLGDIFRSTKNNSLNGPNNRNFSLLGDPSMKLAYPENRLIINEINGTAPDQSIDTLNATEKVTIRGIIATKSGDKITEFNGTLDTEVFDKEEFIKTLGSDGPQFLYKDRINTLFRGKVSVINGDFEFSFVIPKDINYTIDNGKINMYASHESLLIDANGSDVDLLIGGSNSQVVEDNSPPGIELFMDDQTFVNGGVTSSNTLLVAKLSDENGINTSNAGTGHQIVAILDETKKFILNDYYIAELDNYQVGWVTFPIDGLSKGKHTISLKVWDTFNNSSEATIDFIVADSHEFVISNLYNFPNPFINETTFSFDHNHAGEDLEIQLQIISYKGEVIKDVVMRVPNSSSKISNITWDGTNNFSEKIDKGVYIYRLFVRSLLDGSKNQKYQKLVLIN